MIEDLVRASLDHCVKCNICDSYCPFAKATPLFPGPKYVGPQAERFRDGERSPDLSLDYCSGCGICTQVCPQGVKIAEINAQARAKLWDDRAIPLRNKIVARPIVTGRFGVPLAPLANWALHNRGIRHAIERAAGIHHAAPLPRFARRTFQRWFRRHRPPVAQKAVVYFHGCSVNYYEPDVGRMAVAVLEHNGYRVLVPPQDCCGLPLQSNGMFDPARTYVRRLVKNLAPYARRGYAIVSTSTSCGLMLKREAREILGVEDDDLRVVSERLFDICEFLLMQHERGRLRTDFEPLPLTVPYHAPCQLRGHGVGKPAMDLFRLIPELRVIESDADCCGVAGTYGIKSEKYDISMKVGDPLFRQVKAAEADFAACDGETCRWQITQATGVPSVHPVELMYRAYGLRS